MTCHCTLHLFNPDACKHCSALHTPGPESPPPYSPIFVSPDPPIRPTLLPHHVGAQRDLVTGFTRAAAFYLETFHPELNLEGRDIREVFDLYLRFLDADEKASR